MKKILTILIIYASAFSLTQACGVCGCGLGGYYFGFLPNQKMHFVGIRYSSAAFKAHIDNRLIEDEYSNDTYRKAEVLLGYGLTEKLLLTANLPYAINTMDGNLQQIESSGIGDPSVILYWKLLDRTNGLASWSHNLMIGGGLKVPLGEYKKEDQGEIINRNFQLGTGSFDYIFTYNYTFRLGKNALNTEGSLKINTTNDLNYKLGNQHNISLNYYRSVKVKMVSILPFVGISYEIAEKHMDEKILESNTGGKALLGNAGLQVFFGKCTFNGRYQSPLLQRFNTDEISDISSKNRFNIGIVLNISPKIKVNPKVD